MCVHMDIDKVKVNGDERRCAVVSIAAAAPLRLRLLFWCNDTLHVSCVQSENDIDGVYGCLMSYCSSDCGSGGVYVR